MLRHGFSLLELLVVLFLISILLSFAYPSYQKYLIRSHRLEGQLAILDLANRMEQYYAKYNTYAHATIGTGTEHDVLTKALTQQGYYELKIDNVSDQHFIIQAVPQGAQGQMDTACQTLQFDEQGKQTVVFGPGGIPVGTWEECWG
ncbi:MAG: type IV pilin protein [Gammaproteobacteria bacterium]